MFSLGCLMAGCSEENEHVHHVENGDIQERTSSIDVLPDFLDKKPDNMQEVYSLAPKFQKVLEDIPCYCGCGEGANHKNSYDCFVAANKDDGEIVWDDHGTRCDVCLDIAAHSINLANDGKSNLEIRQIIDKKYNSNFGKPTPTPMPKS
jgi:Protein of unknown function with PCYCGC motif